jgi:transcription elongation factor Elf1
MKSGIVGLKMDQDHPRDFVCPRCRAQYKIVRMKMETCVSHGTLQCVVCQEALSPTEDDHILKYFLVRSPRPDLRG